MEFLLQDIHRNVSLHLGSYGFLFGLRKCFLVDLLVLIQWYGINLHRHGRNHVGRLLVHDEVVERLDVNLLIADDIGRNELTAAAAFLVKGLNRSILDTWELTNHSLHLFQFNAEATDLYLSVATANKLDIAGWQITHDIAGTIHACIFLILCKRIRDIDLCRFLRTIQIASAHLGTTDP